MEWLAELPGEAWAVIGAVSGAAVGAIGSWFIQALQRRGEQADRDEREQREAVAAVLSAAFRFMAYSSEPGVYLTSPTRWLLSKRATQAVRDVNALAEEFTRLAVYARLVNDPKCAPTLDALMLAVMNTAKALVAGTEPADDLPAATNALIAWAEARWQPRSRRY